jgi:hypothetical protein
LPSKLNEFIAVKKDYASAVKYYCKARKTLDHYKNMPTFRSIEEDCNTIIGNLKKQLYERLNSSESSSEMLSETVQLLYKLDEPIENLSIQYLKRVEASLEQDLRILSLNIELLESNNRQNNQEIAMDILEFVDHGCNHFLSNLILAIISFNKIFNQEELVAK